MNEISNQQYSYDSVKYIYQYSDGHIAHPALPVKPFKLKGPSKSQKPKKDQDKNKEKENKKPR